MANNNEYNDYSDIYSAKSENTNTSIRNSKLVPFEFSGHASFYDEKDRFNEELVKFIEE